MMCNLGDIFYHVCYQIFYIILNSLETLKKKKRIVYGKNRFRRIMCQSYVYIQNSHSFLAGPIYNKRKRFSAHQDNKTIK